MVDRRDFIKGVSSLTATMMVPGHAFTVPIANKKDRLGEIMQSRPLAGTDESLTMLCVGGYHFGHCSEKEAQKILETALGNGIRFFDCAVSYQNGGSEERYGKLLTPKYRDVSYYMTKTTAKTADKAKQELEDSLRRARTDYLDLWQIHSLGSAEDAENRINNGVLDVFLKAQEEGKVRHIGFTGHVTPDAHLKMLELTEDTKPFTTVQMPINVCDPNYSSFITKVLPKLVEHNISPLAMKTLAIGGFFRNNVVPDKITVEQAVHFAWSLPVTSVVTGAETAEQLQEKIDALKTFEKMDEETRLALIEKVKDVSGKETERYKA